MAYIAVSVGVPDKTDAHRLSQALVENRIAAGTRLSSGMSYYRWEGDVHERMYWTITAFTMSSQLERLYDVVLAQHDDDLPGITYTEIDANDEYLQWIEAQIS
jgi:periplasmic divalent cation tolerance protein